MLKLTLKTGETIEASNARDLLPFLEKKRQGVRPVSGKKSKHHRWTKDDVALVLENPDMKASELAKEIGVKAHVVSSLRYTINKNRVSKRTARIIREITDDTARLFK